MPLHKADFTFLTSIIKQYSGIALDEGKEYLLESRLTPLLSKYNLASLSELAQYMKENKDEELLIEVIEAMTTNESFFFRDIKPFDNFKNVMLPAIKNAHPAKNNIKIWSAACSTGQEAYSLVMTFLESELSKYNTIEIIATDLDLNVIEKAKEATYTQFEIQRGVPINMLLKYFSQDGDQWKLKEEVRSRVKFQKFNLLEDPSILGRFDIIFCRNVLIYFDEPTKKKVLDGIAKVMEPHSFLVTGTAESLIGLDINLKIFPDLTNVFCLK